MTAYIVRRLFQMLPVLLVVTLLVYILLGVVPGDPLVGIVGSEAVSAEDRAALMSKYGFDKPLPVQYGLWLGRVLRGDLGKSTIRSGEPVGQNLLRRAPITLQLGALAFLFALAIALPAGVISATRRNSIWDTAATVVSMAGVALPNFWLGIMLILLFGFIWQVLPPGGYVSPVEHPVVGIKSLLLPALTLAGPLAATSMRQVRSALLEVMAQDYIRTARAKGLAERSVVWVHALKNAMLPVVTVMGLYLGHLIGGAVIVEQVFAIPGVGRMAILAVLNGDVASIQAVVLLVAVSVLMMNLLTDVLYAYLDPRIRYA
ncbi:MAG: ABC transporter permease [Chloroflexi bacterium]|nr:ABC transporter permease [Chloroflexota bacterium]